MIILLFCPSITRVANICYIAVASEFYKDLYTHTPYSPISHDHYHPALKEKILTLCVFTPCINHTITHAEENTVIIGKIVIAKAEINIMAINVFIGAR